MVNLFNRWQFFTVLNIIPVKANSHWFRFWLDLIKDTYYSGTFIALQYSTAIPSGIIVSLFGKSIFMPIVCDVFYMLLHVFPESSVDSFFIDRRNWKIFTVIFLFRYYCFKIAALVCYTILVGSINLFFSFINLNIFHLRKYNFCFPFQSLPSFPSLSVGKICRKNAITEITTNVLASGTLSIFLGFLCFMLFCNWFWET